MISLQKEVSFFESSIEYPLAVTSDSIRQLSSINTIVSSCQNWKLAASPFFSSVRPNGAFEIFR